MTRRWCRVSGAAEEMVRCCRVSGVGEAGGGRAVIASDGGSVSAELGELAG